MLGAGPPVIHAASVPNFEAVEDYVSAGANLDARDNEGRTALIYAVATNCSPCVAALLDGGADPSVRDHDGVSAYSLAEGEIAELLSGGSGRD